MTAMDLIRTEVAHAQQRQQRRDAYRALDRLLDEQDRIASLPWHAVPEGRRGALVAAIADARQRIAELEATADVERMFNLPPVLEVTDSTSAPAWRPGFPPSWELRGGTPPQTWRLGPPAHAAAPPARAVARRPSSKRRGQR